MVRRDRPVGTPTEPESAHTSPCCFRRFSRACNRSDGEIYIDGTFGAGGYTRAILEAAELPRSRDRPRSDRDRARQGALRRVPRPADGRRSALQHAGRCRRCGGLRPGRRRRARYRRLLHATRRARARLLVSGGRPARHAHVAARGDGRRCRQQHRRGRRSRAFSTSWARSAARARSPAPSSRQRAEAPLQTTKALADLVARVFGGRKVDGRHPATRTFQALRIYVNDELGELAKALGAAERCLKPGGPARRRDVPLAGGPHREAVLERALGQGGARLPPSARAIDKIRGAKFPDC